MNNPKVHLSLPKYVNIVFSSYSGYHSLLLNTKEAGRLVASLADKLDLELTDSEREILKKVGNDVDNRYSDC